MRCVRIAKKRKERIKIFDNLNCSISFHRIKKRNKSKGRRGKGIN